MPWIPPDLLPYWPEDVSRTPDLTTIYCALYNLKGGAPDDAEIIYYANKIIMNGGKVLPGGIPYINRVYDKLVKPCKPEELIAMTKINEGL